MRASLGLNHKIVLGHCGQLHDVKNQMFLLDVFHSFHRRYENSALILVGDGQDRQQLERRIEQLQLSKCAHILGFRNDVPQLLMAMDCFVFPSIHEGFPLTLVEAQAAQLPCVVSDTITPTVKLTEALQFASIEAQPEEWVKKKLKRRCVSIATPFPAIGWSRTLILPGCAKNWSKCICVNKKSKKRISC